LQWVPYRRHLAGCLGGILPPVLLGAGWAYVRARRPHDSRRDGGVTLVRLRSRARTNARKQPGFGHQQNLRNMIEISQTGEGLLLSVKVQPKSSADTILGEHGGALKVSVTAAPEKGKANAAVIALLSEKLGVPKSAIEIVRGETSRVKTVRIRGMAKETVSAFLSRLTNSPS
jgi:uncharacterized protein (TIGR00251 family)